MAAFCAARRGRQHEPRRARVDDERDAILRPQLVHEQPKRRLEQRQLVGALIEPDTSIRNTRLLGGSASAVDRRAREARRARAGASGFHGAAPTSVVMDDRIVARAARASRTGSS